MRCFIAINLSLEIKEKIRQIQTSLKSNNHDLAATWVKPSLAHINLHFLGELSKDEDRDVKAGLATLNGKYGPITMVLTNTGAFPGLKNPRVLFLGVKESADEKMLRLYNDVKMVIRNLSLVVESRPFIAHMTLARLRDPRPVNLLTDEMSDFEFQIKTFELMASVLRPDGPEYKIIETYRL